MGVPRVALFLAAAIGLAVALAGAARAAEEVELKEHEWTHSGVFSSFDPAQLRRGFRVYNEVCAVCHSIQYLAFRNLMEIGFTEDEVKEIALYYSVIDGPDDTGEMFERDARPSDYFPSPFPNENAARYANNGAFPPDLSLIIKARANGLDYVYSLLTGYEEEPPEDFELADGMYFNHYFPGHQIAMPLPLYDDLVEYEDGTEASVDQMAEDVTVFLNWMAEPEMDTRKKVGLRVLIFLALFSALFYAVKVHVWSKLH
jgi:ubiquinol-cytochrome c reductase cytochrome c1 subunit